MSEFEGWIVIACLAILLVMVGHHMDWHCRKEAETQEAARRRPLGWKEHPLARNPDHSTQVEQLRARYDEANVSFHQAADQRDAFQAALVRVASLASGAPASAARTIARDVLAEEGP
jgi:hypothetical protein